jgi:predicted MFS family arabinose efflux permease
VTLYRVLPRRRPEHRATYKALLGSTIALARTEPVLVRRALSQALLFGAFTAYWTAVAFVLISRHQLSQTGIAIFALVGAGGALAAPIAGRLGDAGHGRIGRIVAIMVVVLAMGLAGLGSGNLIVLAVAGVLLDLAVQGHQVLSQRDIYSIRPDARARINSVYMTSVFVGGAVASAVTGVVHGAWGWTGVTILGAILACVAAAIWPLDRSTRLRA